MQLFERKLLAQAFRLPLWGQAADETPPQWLVTRLQSSELQVTALGGLKMENQWGFQSCIAGDYVLLLDDDSIAFAKPEEFAAYEPLPMEMALAA